MPLIRDPSARTSPLADIEESVRGTRYLVGADCVIDSFVKFKPAGGTGEIVIGCGVVINSGCVLYSGNGITIGDNVSIAANCVLAPVNHEFADRDRPINTQGFRPGKGGIVIEDDVWIGAGAVVLDGTRIGRGAVIGAMSLVRDRIAPYAIVGGNPLRSMGTR